MCLRDSKTVKTNCDDSSREMNFRGYLMVIVWWFILLLKHAYELFSSALLILNNILVPQSNKGAEPPAKVGKDWTNNEVFRTYGDKTMVSIQTSTHKFHVDLEKLSECSEYFRGLSRSKMKESLEGLIHLDHVPSTIFNNLLEFYFNGRFNVSLEELGPHIQVSSYLLAEAFLSNCLSVLAKGLNPSNCLKYLSLSQDICCPELKKTVLIYLSQNLLELSQTVRSLNDEDKKNVINLRTQGERYLCNLRKENLTSWSDPETVHARHIFILKGQENNRVWGPLKELPFRADKWCFTTAVLYNYLYIIGGYRQSKKRGWEFIKASFRYNPCKHSWTTTSPMIKHRRHFSAVGCNNCIYALGGWYLDSLMTPDSSTALYTAVECYDPWEDKWRFVSPLPLTDFHFTMSLSHDVPLAASQGDCIYVLGSIQRTGKKLFLQYNTKQDVWTELLPTLTRTDAEISTLYFLGTTDKLVVIGGNSSETTVTSFCAQSRKWGKLRRAEKISYAGQGTLVDNQILLPCSQHNTVLQMDLQTLTIATLPVLPVSISYEASFYLHF